MEQPKPKICWHCAKEITTGLVTWQARREGAEKWQPLYLHHHCVAWFEGI